MAETSSTGSVAALEREVAESRRRLAETLDRLTRPETTEAVKRDLSDAAHRAKDEVVARARDAGRSLSDDLMRRARENPLAVALVGAGLAWRLYKRPPVATLLVGAGAAGLLLAGGTARTRGAGNPANADAAPGVAERAGGVAREVAQAARDRASAIAAQGSDVVAQARDAVSEIAAQGSAAAAQARDAVSDAAGRAKTAAAETIGAAGERVTRAASDLSATAQDTLSGALGETLAALERARRNPVVLGAAGLAAGVAIARSIRASDTGERALGSLSETLGAGARRAGDLAAEAAPAARRALETAGTAAASAASSVSEAASAAVENVGETAAQAYRGAAEAASAAYRHLAEPDPRTDRDPPPRSGRRPERGTPVPGSPLRDRIEQLGREYPLLLSAVGLAVGAALGGALRTTESENRAFGETSDRVRRRLREAADAQYRELSRAAVQLGDNLAQRYGGPDPSAARPGAGTASPPGERSAAGAQPPPGRAPA